VSTTGCLIAYTVAIECYVCETSESDTTSCTDPYDSPSSHVVDCGDVAGCSKNVSFGKILGVKYKSGMIVHVLV